MQRIHSRQVRDYVKTFFRPEHVLYTPEIRDRPQGEKVVVLSPHFDDETIGCGGTLIKHAQDGASVTVVFLTDGRGGNFSDAEKEGLMLRRKQEAREATSLLGVTKTVCLDELDSDLKSTPVLLDKLREIFREETPDVVYLPTFLDNHIDHLETNRILLDLSATLEGNPSFTVNAFEGWTPVVPNLVIDITDVVSLKREAVRKYQSQLKYVDYERVAAGLNAYRGLACIGFDRFAEAFLSAPAEEYLQLFRECSMRRMRYIDRRWKRRLNTVRNLFTRAAHKGLPG